jgi:hypothetical protein
VPNVNLSYREMQSAARQLQEGGQLIEADLQRLRRLVDSVVTSGRVELSPREGIR